MSIDATDVLAGLGVLLLTAAAWLLVGLPGALAVVGMAMVALGTLAAWWRSKAPAGK